MPITGVSTNELIARTCPPRRPQPDQKALQLIATIRQWQAEDATDDEDERSQRKHETTQLHASLDQTRQDAGMLLLFRGEQQA